MLQKQASWRAIVFGLYTVAAFVSVVCFAIFVLPMDQAAVKKRNMGVGIGAGRRARRKGPFTALTSTDDGPDGDEEEGDGAEAGNDGDDGNGKVVVMVHDSIRTEHLHRLQHVPRRLYGAASIKKDISAVFRAMTGNPRLQLMLPYQLTFGFSSGFIGFYVMKNVVGANLGDGYIGLLSALGTLTAVILAWPFEIISKRFSGRGKWYVMVFAAGCFAMVGMPFLLTSNDASLGSWTFVVPYFIVWGAGRGAWESTNKATIAEYFANDPVRDAAFAAVYFASGLSGAFGYFFYKHMTRFEMATLNTIMPLIALVSYHLSERVNYELGVRNRVLAAAVVRGGRAASGNTESPSESYDEDEVNTSMDYHGDAHLTVDSRGVAGTAGQGVVPGLAPAPHSSFKIESFDDDDGDDGDDDDSAAAAATGR